MLLLCKCIARCPCLKLSGDESQIGRCTRTLLLFVLEICCNLYLNSLLFVPEFSYHLCLHSPIIYQISSFPSQQENKKEKIVVYLKYVPKPS
jgi:hypothetical protein